MRTFEWRASSDNVKQLLRTTPSGLYCQSGGFFIDPSRSVDRAIITHAHGDHARSGSREYRCASSGVSLLKSRLRRKAAVQAVEYGERFRLGDVSVSLHPAGHVLGSAQVRIEGGGEVWVVSGDFKRQPDPSCEPFEVVPCDVFVSEATFAWPACRWAPGEAVVREIFDWWEGNRRSGRASALFCYALGKAQRILAELARITDREAVVHAEIEPLVACYRDAGVRMLATRVLPRKIGGRAFAGELVLAPPRYLENSWLARFGDVETAMASGWMYREQAVEERGCDRGFALSDHADWPDLLKTISETGARTVLVDHGRSEILTRHLRSEGIEAHAVKEYLKD